ncbi:hypothetical protein THASP1DRAFT_25072 [Thamnocephalis sphaerospora]|uniref:HIG1 domain-containing protein n=1 Tax=Thamnocephalis sphaerospora TaxID=78915 RepID=A0A4V1IW82_9FUNG|nr:hypothetical protein THASP1DRAFT_25072 [Thamnocephalis sphaerospora]|eukprot:RKP06649.1 hypothetical protein THASP1DRAFT_25072 [Thamnocephalis sphaerospora]
MKILTQEETDAMYSKTLRGGAKGFALGLAGSLALSVVAQRFMPGYRRLTLPLKAMFVTGGTAAYTVIVAEHAMQDFANAKHVERVNSEVPLEQVLYGENALKAAMLEHEVRANEPIAKRTIDFINANRWSVVGGTWAAGMAASGTYLWAQRYMTWQQKLVQARMYAQLITIVALLATAVISVTDTPADMKEYNKDDSWRRAIAMPENNAVSAAHH